MSFFRSMLAWLLVGAAWGGWSAAETAAANPTVRGESGAYFALWLVLAFATVGLAIGVAWAVLSRWRSPRARAGDFVVGAFLATGLALGLVVLTSLVESSVLRWGVRALAMGPIVWAGLALQRRALPPLVPAGLAVGALLAVGFGVLSAAGDGSPEAVAGPGPAAPVLYPASGPVILVGIDGADWRRLDALFAQGRLPNLERLSEEGVRASLRTTVPTWSPILWTTIATGRSDVGHGIFDFTEIRFPGMRCGVQRLRKEPVLTPPSTGVRPLLRSVLGNGGARFELPITGCNRQSKALWNIASDYGRSSAVVNWFATWPAEAIQGFLISDNNPERAAFLAIRAGSSVGDDALLYPRGLLEQLGDLGLPELSDDPAEILQLSLFDDLRMDEREELLRAPSWVDVFQTILRTDSFAVAALAKLLRDEPLDFAAVYLSGVDNISHRFRQRTGVVDRYYEATDAFVGRLVEAALADATFVIVSDHGWEYGGPGEPFGHAEGPPGIFIAHGPGAAAARRLDPLDIADVAPTVLALLGFPVDASMEGRVIADAVAPPVQQWLLTAGRHDYGPYTPRPLETSGVSAGPLQDETMEKLRALGYVE